jgi:hypothetical protein
VESGQGFRKRPERFQFQEDWAVDLSEGEISAFRELGVQKIENRGNTCIGVSQIAKAGSAWSWTVISTFQNPGFNKREGVVRQGVLTAESRNREF